MGWFSRTFRRVRKIARHSPSKVLRVGSNITQGKSPIKTIKQEVQKTSADIKKVADFIPTKQIDAVVKNTTDKAVDAGMGALKEGMSKTGLDKPVGALWKSTAKPLVNFTHGEVKYIKEKFKSIPYAESILKLAQKHPVVAQVVRNVNDADKILMYLKNEDFDGLVKATKDRGVQMAISKYLPKYQKIKLAKAMIGKIDSKIQNA